MLKRIWTLFIRDIKVNTREAMTLFLIAYSSYLLAVGINLISPGINDTTSQCRHGARTRMTRKLPISTTLPMWNC